MKIENGFFFVSGMYFISGVPGKKTAVTLPLPNGASYGEIDSLHIYDVLKSEYLSIEQRNRKSVQFTVEFNDSGEYLIQIYYRIKLLGNKAEYPFGKNLLGVNKMEKACFYLIAPTNLEAHHFNYIPKDTIDAGLNVVYYWEYYDFTPGENFAFRIR